MDSSLHISQFKEYFGDCRQFATSDIKKFYHQFDTALSRSTLDWRIYQLKAKGVLKSVGRGIYSMEDQEAYLPETRLVQRLASRLKKEFPFLEICLWNTGAINEFMLHQPGKFYTMVEVEKDAMESVFYFLQGIKANRVFLNPSEKSISLYSQNGEMIIVRHLISEAPVQIVDAVTTITIEKMLVDIYCNPVIFSAQQGSELETIYSNAFEKYAVDVSRLLRYASRRGKKKELANYIKELRNGN